MDESISKRHTHLQRVVRNGLRRSEGKLEKQKVELSQAAEWERFQQIGDTLSANFHTLQKGLEHIRLPNVHTGEEIEIRLDPSLMPQENVESYYRRARKAKRAGPVLAQQIERTEKDVEFFTGLQNQLSAMDAVEDPALCEREMASIENKLINAGFLPKPSVPKAAPEPEQGFRRVILEEKWTVLIGRNDAENDDLTLHVARPHDLWFHAYGSPGSHVVLRRDSRDEVVPRSVIEQTAALAAWFSKQKHSTKVAVNYTEKRYVRKPRKAPAGLVMIEREKTVYVRPWNPHEKSE